MAPLRPSLLFWYGQLLMLIKRHARALEVFREAARENPRRLGRFGDAATRFQEAARLQPLNPYAGYQLAGIWHRLGRGEKVRAEYERIRGFDPKVAERIRVEFGVQPE